MQLALLASFAVCAVASPNNQPIAPVGASPTEVLPLATLDETLSVRGETVKAQVQQNRLSVPVMIGGAGPFRFVVDSGADHSVVGRDLASRLKLAPSGCVRLHSIAGMSINPTVHVPALRLGSDSLEDLDAPTLPEAYLKGQGMIGIDALVDQRIALDFDRRAITIEDARTRLVERPGDIVVTARRKRGQLILAEAVANATPILAVIDTGAEITMGNSVLRARLFGRRRRPDVRSVELISVTGEKIVADLMILPELVIGHMKLRNLPVAFTDAPPFTLFGLSEQPAVLLGTDVLQAFRAVTLDFRRRKVRFTLR